MFGLGVAKEKLQSGLEAAHRRITEISKRFGTVSNVAASAEKACAKLAERVYLLEHPPVNDQNVYRIIEDLKNRMPKGSAVSDFRFDELVAKVHRLEIDMAQFKSALANARALHNVG